MTLPLFFFHGLPSTWSRFRFWYPAVPSAQRVFEDTSSLFTDQWQTHQTAVSKHFPPSGLHLPLPMLIAQGAEDAGELVGELQMPGHWGRKSVRVWIRAFFVVKENKRINEKKRIVWTFASFVWIFPRLFHSSDWNLYYCNLNEKKNKKTEAQRHVCTSHTFLCRC